ncbi:hypothetical protein OSTOST_21529 [Ostertagia ostertagi]
MAPLRKRYPPRYNMGLCEAKFGKVTVFIGYLENVLRGEKFRVAQDTIKCYLKGVNYKLMTVNLENDERTRKLCYKYNDVMIKSFNV